MKGNGCAAIVMRDENLKEYYSLGGTVNRSGFFNFGHFFHHDGIYFFSHNYICFAPFCLFLCNLVVLGLLHH